jgi:hypothetical protein
MSRIGRKQGLVCGAAVVIGIVRRSNPFAAGMQNNAATNSDQEAADFGRFGAAGGAALWRVDHVTRNLWICGLRTTDMPVAAVEFAGLVY